MAYFPDLSDAGPGSSHEQGSYVAEGAVYVGWLAPERGFEFETTEPMEASTDYLAALRWLIDPSSVCDQITVFSTRGFHTCPLCENEALGDGERIHTGSRHFLVPGIDRNYLVPDLITHYVDDHCYAAPAEFQEALIAVYRRRGDTR